MSRKALIALIVIMVAAGGYYIFKRFNGNNPDGDKKETVTTNKSSQKLDANKVNELLLGKWEIADQNIVNTKHSSTLNYIKSCEMMEFLLDNRYRKHDNEFSGRVGIGTNPYKNWSLNSDGTKIVISDDIFEISFSEDKNQLTLTKPEENITITLKRW
jgi:hypothetical protein